MRIRSTKPGRYKKRAIPGPVKVAVVRAASAKPGGTSPIECAYCGAKGEVWWPLTYTDKVGCHMVMKGFEFDHVHPEFHGGAATPENIVIACRPCNRSKGAKISA